MIFVDVAVPGPFRNGLQYIFEESAARSNLIPPAPLGSKQSLPRGDLLAIIGCRVLVPLQKREVVGVVTGVSTEAQFPVEKMKSVIRILDEVPLFDEKLRELMQFMRDYYHVSLGEVYYTALPKLLTQDKKERARSAPSTPTLLRQGGGGHPFLNQAQQKIVDAILPQLSTPSIHLIEGVTGSGKTEVYLDLVEAVLKAGKSVLVLVPEIGLTPQTVQRFNDRFPGEVVPYHSGLTDTAKRSAWRNARAGEARLVIGTRSSIFLPLQNLGLIVMDEEHDLSYKQQTGIPYSAKSMAVMRARQHHCPLILGSATPSVESLYFASEGRYHHHYLTEQAKGGAKAQVQIIDMRSQQKQAGLSQFLLENMRRHLEAGHQVLIFLNRRGYAPILMCESCGVRSTCPHCDIAYTVHQQPAFLMCHHCGFVVRIPQVCGQCHHATLIRIGIGTEQLEQFLSSEFERYGIIRLDQDATRKKGELARLLTEIHEGSAQLIVGTQMISKGHDFTKVTLVGIVDLDYGFFSPDFRSIERMGQLLVQVSGRAGRAELPGEVLIQTHVPDHPLLLTLLKQGYAAFAQILLEERKVARLPPFQYLALFRAEHPDEEKLMVFLKGIKTVLDAFSEAHPSTAVRASPPIFASLKKRGGRFRAQILIESGRRTALQAALNALEDHLSSMRGVPRFTIDVDPMEVV